MKLVKKLVPVYLLVIIATLSVGFIMDKAVTVLAPAKLERPSTVYIIDPGHGGIDGGATSCTGVLESQINLEIAHRVNDLFCLMGYDTIMIRTTDESVYTEGSTIAAQKISDLKERVRITNEAENGLLVSIHQNTYSDSRYNGAQVFYAPTEGSEQLAKQLQQDMISTLNLSSTRRAKKADSVYFLQHITCPGVLIECGFLTNPQEEANLRNAEYQKKLAAVIASSCSRFLSETE